MRFSCEKALSIAAVLLTLLLACPTFAQLYNAFPDNVRQSFAWGITDNKVLSRYDLIAMASVVIMQRDQVSEYEATERCRRMYSAELAQIATEPLLIEYVEVPISELQKLGEFDRQASKFMDSADQISPIHFSKNGQEYVRWFIHPLRRDHSFLKMLGNPPVLQGEFLAQLTESRSVIIMNRTSGEYWSIKLSLPQIAVGPFKDKQYKAEMAAKHFKASEHIIELQGQTGDKETHFMHEQEFASVKIRGFSEGQLVRSLKILKSGNFLLPYSAIYSYGLGKYLPQGQDVQAAEHRWLSIEPGLAAAESYTYAYAHTSNHSQNSVLLLSPNHIPLQYLRRDFDLDVDPSINPDSKFIAIFPKADVGDTAIDFSMTNGFDGRSYYQGAAEQKIVDDYYATFVSRYQQLMHLPPRPDIQGLVHFSNGHYSLDPVQVWRGVPLSCTKAL